MILKTSHDLLKIVSRSTERSLYVFNLDKLDVFRQLRFEEFLYRNISPVSFNSAFFLVNNHHFGRAVIFGLSGNPSEFIRDFDFCRKNNIKLIKRFTGGGTVLIDENSLTSSLIANHSFAPGLNTSQISNWTFDNFYSPCKLFNNNFSLLDGDYVIKSCNSSNNVKNDYENKVNDSNKVRDNNWEIRENLDRSNKEDNIKSNNNNNNNKTKIKDITEKEELINITNKNFMYHKIGGNAQAYSKDSFVHHTSFIWNVSPLIEKVLRIPKRAPKYRNNRNHSNFLTSVSNALNNPSLDKYSFANSLRDSIFSNIKLHNQPQTYLRFNFKYVSKSDTTPSQSLSQSTTNSTNTLLNESFLFDDSFIDSCIDSLDKSNTTYLSY